MSDDERARLLVRVKPKARQNRVIKFEEGVLHLMIAAPPVNGKANRELIRFLSDFLGVSKSSLTIEKGLTSRRKTISVAGSTPEQLAEIIGRLLP